MLEKNHAYWPFTSTGPASGGCHGVAAARVILAITRHQSQTRLIFIALHEVKMTSGSHGACLTHGAFVVRDDHEAQERVFQQEGEHSSPFNIRRLLAQNEVPNTDRRVPCRG